ncbi:MAG TPA: peptide-methionine (S)-S-oxide reductase, partial [Thermoanaerobaculia bacterium]|nr:peptide-methionine (S)-S-oxide reductase [Thermoanaerobaculia bacterium]
MTTSSLFTRRRAICALGLAGLLGAVLLGHGKPAGAEEARLVPPPTLDETPASGAAPEVAVL